MTATTKNDDLLAYARLLMPVALLALAAAIAYFTFQLGQVSKQIPDILQRIDSTTEKAAPVVTDVSRAIDLVPLILEEVEAVRNSIPPILDEVKAVRTEVKAVRTDVVPPIIDQIEQTNQQIPAVLAESEAIRADLPAVLKTADQASATIAETNKQIEASLPRVDRALDEAEITRKEIPGWMDRADGMIDKASVAGQKASEGAITGFFSGLIKAPFALVAGAGETLGFSSEEIRELDENDLEMMKIASLYLLNEGAENEERTWRNPDSGHEGTVTITELYTRGEYEELACVSLNFTISSKGKSFKEKERSFCKNEEGAWEPDND